jgi:hypothetical protein
LEENIMAKCEKCGNEYDKAFVIEKDGQKHTFDCFECAISVLAPNCEHCNVRIVGHGVEVDDRMYCCAHCAEENGEEGLVDRVVHGSSRR